MSNTLQAQAVPAPPLLAPAVLLEILTEKGIGPDIVIQKNKDEVDEKDKYIKQNQLNKIRSA